MKTEHISGSTKCLLIFVSVLALLPCIAMAGTEVTLDAELMQAAKTGNLPLVKILLEKGAHVETRNETGATPLMEASVEGKRSR